MTNRFGANREGSSRADDAGSADAATAGSLRAVESAELVALMSRVAHGDAEAFLQAWRTAASFDPARGSVVSWLMTSAHRRAVDRVRSEQAGTDREALYESTNLFGPFDEVFEEVDRRLEHQSVLACLDSLSDIQRESVAMAYYEGRTYSEVAAQSGIALSTVKTRIRDGITRLRGGLGMV
ncbi:MAG: sigma-70 family RNA polymerase sigma factor [Rhodococcus sp. (in: high G+C Gram-positive bacteria)]|uniref:sigma-70 family RNA polymerase sigma factor n=1 Tax=Rhodococcus sp. TaxID=1831 RepID=UPI003BB038D8